MPRLPLTIWFLVTLDLWKLLLLTSAILVGVISFAVTIGPLSDGELSPIDAIRFMLFASVPMLAYALPFAAGFAATLIFHRMSQDNELLAAHAGGVSHRRILVPAVVTGLVLAVVVGIMSDQIIPKFLRNMERLITEDIAKLMISRLGQGETVEFGGNTIYADSVQWLDPSEMTSVQGAEDVFVLSKAAFANLDQDKKMKAGFTSARAFIVIRRSGDITRGAGSVVTLVAENYNSWGEGYNFESTDRLRYDFAVPGAFRDDPKYWSFGELQELHKNPKLLAQVWEWHKKTAYRAATLAMMQDVSQNLQSSGSCELPLADGGKIVIKGGRLGPVDWLSRPILPNRPGDPIVVERHTSDGGVSRFVAQSATFNADKAEAEEVVAQSVSAKIVLEEVTTGGVQTSSAEQVTGRRRMQTISGVLAAEGMDLVMAYEEMSLAELLTETGFETEVDRALGEAQYTADQKEQKLQREIVSKTHQRLAMSAACFVMVLIGATMAMKLRDALPLTVYLWAFIPALTSILVISTGEQFAQQVGWPGLLLMWGSIAGLLAYAGVTYKQVATR
jgi:lipopolysaccharide export LptBFGC system permease protein LptF